MAEYSGFERVKAPVSMPFQAATGRNVWHRCSLSAAWLPDKKKLDMPCVYPNPTDSSLPTAPTSQQSTPLPQLPPLQPVLSKTKRSPPSVPHF
jgi:hypothetical protein